MLVREGNSLLSIRSKMLIVLDLDETLIHSSERLLERSPDFIIDEFFVYKRPYLDAFLDHLFGRFEVGVWTSGGAEYAEAVATHMLGPRRAALQFFFTRSRCTRRYDPEMHQYYYPKDLKKVKRLGFRSNSKRSAVFIRIA